MADVTASQVGTREPLGVGNIIGDSFSIFFKRIIPILIIGSVITFLSYLVNILLFGASFVTGSYANDPAAFDNPTTLFIQIGISTVISMVFFGIMIGAYTLLAYDTKLGRSARIGTYIMAAFKNVLPIAILWFVASIIITIGTVFVILPGLWLLAVLCAIVPAIVVEGAGFGAMGRSASLTKGYRWPIIGTWLVFLIIFWVAMMIVGGVAAAVMVAAGGAAEPSTMSTVLFVVVTALLSALSYGLLSIPAALIYARLREIKEGISVDSLADVFS